MSRLVDWLVILAVLLAVWSGLHGWAGDVAITPPLRTLAFAAHLLAQSTFWRNAGATMLAFA